MSDQKLATVAVRTGIDSDTQYNAVVPPLYLTSTYSFPQLGEVPTYDYSRSGNPTRNTLADALSTLEGGAGGRGHQLRDSCDEPACVRPVRAG
ncbi:cystathionine gamma-synthase [Photobacterium aphoticum]|uniref:Cystathionine gamma-synthase n=1 Tax=Photobacterium aphoticum TaxID=754436 RepID=A0A090QRL4_9GAMM|nr:cystathionine gamma-synthase [Photobacterium aphoticum]